MHLHGEGLEALPRVEADLLDDRRVPRDQAQVAGEAHVDGVAPVGDRLAHEGVGDRSEVGKGAHLPDDVVAEPDAVEGLVEPLDAAWHAIE
ncbi:MAG: hypothetical protein LKH08_00415 [Atopobiaceae bacterium]|jgi:hypothetical protein|nr:hypothetical protein [Atopobiaceae bacterium]MCH4120111.1 hypothetical protein [Atopobiaceae bacterium]MCI1431377.1 hypothetical protein [Atopobiaceae bacterium]MCI1469813.1 hypothetical protein [Atopobiaceae bacterium]